MGIARKIVFYLFVTIYLTLCPLLILRMLGYVFNPQKPHIVKTGIIYVSTNPPGANVYINNIQTHEQTPTIIRDLTPASYDIRIELKDYEPWQSHIPVVERKATALENILLIPKQWIVKPLSSKPFEKILPLGDGSALLLWKEQTIKDLCLLKLNKALEDTTFADMSLVSSVFPEESIYNSGSILNFFTVEKSPFFVIHVILNEKHKYLWIDIRDKQIHIEDISDLLPEEPLRLWWEVGDEKNIYAFYNDHVNRIDIKAKSIYPGIAFKEEPQKNIPSHSANIKGRTFDEHSDMWLEFTHKKIGIWDPKLKFMQWIFESGKHIEQAFWINNANAILYRDQHQVFLLNRHTFGPTQTPKVTRVLPNSTIYYSEKTGKLYYIEPDNQLLSAITILKHRPMLPKNIADTLRLKEFQP
jgi:hypothetical protein